MIFGDVVIEIDSRDYQCCVCFVVSVSVTVVVVAAATDQLLLVFRFIAMNTKCFLCCQVLSVRIAGVDELLVSYRVQTPSNTFASHTARYVTNSSLLSS